VAFKHFAYGDSKRARRLAFCHAADVSVETPRKFNQFALNGEE
jgi:hypothetical protein